MLDPINDTIDDNAMMRLYLVHGDNYFDRLLDFKLGRFEGVQVRGSMLRGWLR